MPRMLEPFDWKECKAFFVREAGSIVLPPYYREQYWFYNSESAA